MSITKVQVSQDGEIWVSIPGAKVRVKYGKRQVSSQHASGSDKPIIKAGKRGSDALTCNFICSEATQDALGVLREAEKLGHRIYIRFVESIALNNWRQGVGVLTGLFSLGLDFPEYFRFGIICGLESCSREAEQMTTDLDRDGDVSACEGLP